MKKFLLMLVICVSSFIIYTNNVYADSIIGTRNHGSRESLGGNYLQETMNLSYYFQTAPITSSIHGSRFDFYSGSDGWDYRGADYFSFIYAVGMYFPNSVTETTYVDISTNCSARENITINNSDTITYADGTTAGISGNDTIRSLCYGWSLGGTLTTSKAYYDSSYSAYIRAIYSDNTAAVCDINGTNVTCPVNNKIVNRISITIIHNNTIQLFVGVSDTRTMYKSDTKSILDKLNDLNTSQQNINNNVNEIKNDIKSDNVSGAESSADDLKNNSAFQDNSGLSGVISMPLTFVNSLTNTCQPINLNIPYMDVNVTIPCMQSVITDKMPLLANLIKIIVNGFIVYRILLDIFQIVRNAKNPEDDRIEVLDL